MHIPPHIADAIQDRYRRNLAAFPLQKARVDAFCTRLAPTEKLCMQQLLGSACAADLLRYTPAVYHTYVKATLTACRRLPYMRGISPEMLLTYVLPARVNNEQLDGCRPALLAAVLPHVKGCKTLAQAALAVNYWCSAHGTYTPTDDRTIGPAGFWRAGRGRCGEESTFAVNALRAAGIPARQVYSPRWAHCDDNHAWVEVWCPDGWHYLGACEPEPVLDRGWFTGPASRAMVVHTRAPGLLEAGDAPLNQNPHGRLVHTTARYADTVTLTVQLCRAGAPVPGHPIDFLLANESRLFTVYTGFTDKGGRLTFETGAGCLLVRSADGDAAVEALADLAAGSCSVRLDLADARTPAQLAGTGDAFVLTPPAGLCQPPAALPDSVQAVHGQRMAACENARTAREKDWYAGDGADPRTLARGNRAEIEAFLADDRFDAADKTTLLSTLRPKDFLDVTAALLADTLRSALPHRPALPAEIWRTALLAPRVANEPLTTLPTALRHAWRQLHRTPVTDGAALWQALHSLLKVIPDDAPAGVNADPAACLAAGVVPAGSLDILYVCLARALGMPARLDPLTGRPAWWRAGRWLDAVTAAPAPTAPLLLQNGGDAPLFYGRQYTLALWQNGGWHTLPAGEGLPAALAGNTLLTLPAGCYQLTCMTRRLNGAAALTRRWFTLPGTESLVVAPPPDTLADQLQAVPLAAQLPAGLLPDSPAGGLLIWVQPGEEPTEHLLRELLALESSWNAAPCTLTVLTPLAGFDYPLLATLAARLQRTQLLLAPDAAALAALQKAMGTDDARLPFALAFDQSQRGLAAFANYNIDTAALLLKILQAAQ